MVRQGIDEDPSAEAMKKSLPPPLRKRLQPKEAGKAIVDGIARRKARIIRPRRWAAFSVLRGVINPLLDEAMVKADDVQEIARELDGREGEEQPTTA
jgi:hypothetical protein